MGHFILCRERFGGLCPTKDDCDPATFLTYNMFLSCKGLKKELPIMLEFSARDCFFFLVSWADFMVIAKVLTTFQHPQDRWKASRLFRSSQRGGVE